MNERMATRFCRDDGTVAELRDLFYSDQWQVLEERVRPSTGGVSSQADVQNVWSPVYVDALIERDRDADASATTGVGGLEERVYALQDANWNTTALVVASVSGVAAGTVLNRFIYSAYGEAEAFDAAWSSVSAPSVPWTQLFQGLSMTGLTGLAYVRHRDYSPRLGRFIQRDPLGFEAGDTNWYRFVGNAPMNWVDPTGEYGGRNASGFNPGIGNSNAPPYSAPYPGGSRPPSQKTPTVSPHNPVPTTTPGWGGGIAGPNGTGPCPEAGPPEKPTKRERATKRDLPEQAPTREKAVPPTDFGIPMVEKPPIPKPPGPPDFPREPPRIPFPFHRDPNEAPSRRGLNERPLYWPYNGYSPYGSK